MRSDEPSPLLSGERALLEGFLTHDFVGVDELRDQARHVSSKRGCECGCGTIEFTFDGVALRRSASANPVPVDAVVRDAHGNEAGGLILFVRDGLLQSLEVYSHAEPLPLPRLDQVTWRA